MVPFERCTKQSSYWRSVKQRQGATGDHLFRQALALERPINHRNALEAAEVSHRNALEIAREQVEAERLKWMTEAQRAACRAFQSSLGQLRRALLADELVPDDVNNAFHELHESQYAVHEVGPRELRHITFMIKLRCEEIMPCREQPVPSARLHRPRADAAPRARTETYFCRRTVS